MTRSTTTFVQKVYFNCFHLFILFHLYGTLYEHLKYAKSCGLHNVGYR